VKKHETEKKWYESFIIRHNSNFLMFWNVIVDLIYIYTFFVVPYVIAFQIKPLESIRGIETVLDFLMLLAILLNFITERKAGKQIISDQKMLAMKYLTTRFGLDTLATLPSAIVLNDHER